MAAVADIVVSSILTIIPSRRYTIISIIVVIPRPDGNIIIPDRRQHVSQLERIESSNDFVVDRNDFLPRPETGVTK
jgi:hypothetical protein